MVYIGAVLCIVGLGILIQPVVKQFLKIRRYSAKVHAVCTGQKPYINYLNLKMKNPVFTYTYKGVEYSSVLRLYKYREKKNMQKAGRPKYSWTLQIQRRFLYRSHLCLYLGQSVFCRFLSLQRRDCG